MNNKKWIVLTGIVLVVLVFVLIGVRSNVKTGKLLREHAFSLTESVPVGETLNLNKVNNKNFAQLLSIKNPKVLIFGRVGCDFCAYLSFPLKEWVNEYKNLDFIYVDISGNKPTYLNVHTNNFHLILDNPDAQQNLANTFRVRLTPTIFFLNKDNKIIWKRSGFLITDYKDLTKHLMDFSHNQMKFQDYQRNIITGKEMPSIIYNYNKKEIIFPDDFKGKPTLIYLFMDTCKSCKSAFDQIPKSIYSNTNVNKVIIFAGSNQQTIKEALFFAQHFSMKILENEIKQNIGHEELSYSYLKDKLYNYKDTILIRDDFFKIQNMLGLPGAPFLIALNKNGEVVGVYSIASNNKEISSAVLKILLERR